MAKAALGAKRQCQSCGVRFFDRGRPDAACPKCGAAQAAAAEGRTIAPPAVTAAPRAARPQNWSVEQQGALDKVGRWLRAGDPQVFRLFGYAGVGKTTLARHVAEGAAGEAAFAAFTGKAALVMRSKGCAGATTIHALIYRASDGEEGSPTFKLNHDGPASKAGLIVIDECSMVDAELGRDLLSFGKPILVLGDPAQLPPVRGGGYFTDAEADVMLTHIHRQAENDPIIRLSHIVREGGALSYGAYGESRIIRRAEVDPAEVLAADQVLVGINRTRRAYNARIRALRGVTEPLPVAGDRLVCLRNDRVKGLINGGLWTVETLHAMRKDFIRMTVTPQDEGGRSARVSVLKQFFEGAEASLAWPLRRESDEFDYGYALTVHKAQGSQWDDVMLFDESAAFSEHRDRWLYTGLTRAAKRLTIVR